MATSDRTKWDAKHAERAGAESAPDPLALEAIELARALPGPWPRRALDVACGAGRHLVALARAGYDAKGFDVSPVGLSLAAELLRGAGLRARLDARDFDDVPLARGRYDLVLVVDFLARPRLRELAAALRRGGVLAIVGFLEGRPAPSPRFCHRAGELAAAFADLEVLRSREEGGRVLFVARRPRPAAP